MSSAAGLVEQLVKRIQAELASYRVTLSGLSRATRISRTTIYENLQSRRDTALHNLCALADAAGITWQVSFLPNRQPDRATALLLLRPRPKRAPSLPKPPRPPKPPKPARPSPPQPRPSGPLSDAVINEAWQEHPQNIPAVARALRITVSCCLRRCALLGLVPPRNPFEERRIARDRCVAQAVTLGESWASVGRDLQIPSGQAQQTAIKLRLLAVTVAPPPVVATSLPDPEQRISVNDLARAAGMPPHLLRSWTNHFGWPPVLARLDGRVWYAPEVATDLREVYRLHNLGRSLRDLIGRGTPNLAPAVPKRKFLQLPDVALLTPEGRAAHHQITEAFCLGQNRTDIAAAMSSVLPTVPEDDRVALQVLLDCFPARRDAFMRRKMSHPKVPPPDAPSPSGAPAPFPVECKPVTPETIETATPPPPICQ